MTDDADAFARSLWSITAAPAPPAPPLEGDAACDVAVIGAGILGLATALALASTGVRVIVLEAATIGFGASGRSGGLVVPSLPRIGPDQVRAKLGEARAARLLGMIASGADAVFALIRRQGILCDAAQTGWLHPVHAASLVPAVRGQVASWQEAGSGCLWLGAEETRRRMGSERFHGALFDPSGGHLDPLGYTRGLARAALAAGAAVHEQTPAIAVRGDRRCWAVETPGGRVQAKRVLQATNAMPPGVPGAVGAAVRNSTVPLLVYQMATPVMPAAARRAVLAGGEAFSDTRHNLLACRWTAAGRLVTGGMAALHAGATARLPRRLARRLEGVFPALGPVRFTHIWRGCAALTGDFLPRLMEPAPGWLAVSACNGRGIVMATTLGPVLADYLRTGDATGLPLPLMPPRPIPLLPLARLLPQMLLPLGDWQDRRAEGRVSAE